jgi:hypothetical protein
MPLAADIPEVTAALEIYATIDEIQDRGLDGLTLGQLCEQTSATPLDI